MAAGTSRVLLLLGAACGQGVAAVSCRACCCWEPNCPGFNGGAAGTCEGKRKGKESCCCAAVVDTAQEKKHSKAAVLVLLFLRPDKEKRGPSELLLRAGLSVFLSSMRRSLVRCVQQ